MHSVIGFKNLGSSSEQLSEVSSLRSKARQIRPSHSIVN